MACPNFAAAVDLALACMLYVWVRPAAAQLGQCEVWAGQPAVCGPYLQAHGNAHSTQTRVFVPAQFGSQGAMEAEVLRQLDPALRAAPGGCRKAATQLVCLSVFLACADETLAVGNATWHLPRFVCSAACESVNYECGGLDGFTAVDCAQLEPTSGLPFYPRAVTSLALLPNTTAIDIPCYADARVPARVPVETCPYNFHYDARADTCLPACPNAYCAWSSSEQHALRWIKLCSSTVSLIIFIPAVLPWILVKDRRKFPTYVPLFFSLSFMMVQVGLLVSSILPHEEFVCEDRVTLNAKSFIPCRFQAWTLIVFAGSGLGWLMNMCINAFIPVWFDIQRWSWHLEVAENVVGWGPSLLYMIVMEGVGEAGGMAPDYQVCFTADDDINTLLPFFVIVTVYVVVGNLFLLLALGKLFYIKWVLNREWGIMEGTRRIMKDTRNSLQFATTYSVVVVYAVFFLWYMYFKFDAYVDAIEGSAACNAAGENDCHVEQHIPFGLFVSFLLILSVYPAVAILLVFSCRKWAFDMWKSLLRGEIPDGITNSGAT